ncbi:peroxidase family protein [Actinokineospora spheciospongiae]|uniref:hypothetical protein n=1 Tax=Actinokineospora spheciospongiae TaxID=909613 RepID=UPI001268227D|nr:hypothetical protein [Actinokineospora spheciospongiae]
MSAPPASSAPAVAVPPPAAGGPAPEQGQPAGPPAEGTGAPAPDVQKPDPTGPGSAAGDPDPGTGAPAAGSPGSGNPNSGSDNTDATHPGDGTAGDGAAGDGAAGDGAAAGGGPGHPGRPDDAPTTYIGAPDGTSGTPADQPPPQSKGYWDVDPAKLAGFSVACTAARFGLAAVQTRVERMQGEDYTPQLGTSPVGRQLARKFDDRLNGDTGLRGLLAEAMRRMDRFIESAEKVRDGYRESEEIARDAIGQAEQRTAG